LFYRQLGQSDIQVSALGLGCWAIGGPYQRNQQPMGWGKVDDKDSQRAIEVALEHGINFFDTADLYGCGHSEEVLGKALTGKRPDVVIASKFGYKFNEQTKIVTGRLNIPDEIEDALHASLKRLRTDYLDLYQLHISDFPETAAEAVQDRLEKLIVAGKIRSYGWSTDDASRVSAFAPSKFCVAVQQALNVLQGDLATLAATERRGMASLCRSPLAMGILTGKWSARKALPGNDLRSRWNHSVGPVPTMVKVVESIRHILSQDGRSLTQGALAWLWAKSDTTVPIPGFRNATQVLENVGAVKKGPLTEKQMLAIDKIVSRDFPNNPWDLRRTQHPA